MKKVTNIVVSLALMLGLTGCTGVTDYREYLEGAIVPIASPAMPIDGEPITLIYNEINPPDSIVGQLGTEFKRLVEQKSSGNITIELHYSGELATEDESLEHIKAGDGIVDISRTSTLSNIDPDGCGRSDILTLPYTFISRDHFWAFAKSDLATVFIKEAEDGNIGLKVLMFGEEGFRCFFSDKPVESITDMQGLKLRTYNKPVMELFISNLNASVVDVPFSELKSAISDGTIDGAEQPITNYLSNKFFVEAPYLIRDNHTLGLFALIISQAKWDSMTNTQRAVINSAITELVEFNEKISASTEASTIKQLQIEGCNVIDLKDTEAWERAAYDTQQLHIVGHLDDYNAIYELRPKEGN